MPDPLCPALACCSYDDSMAKANNTFQKSRLDAITDTAITFSSQRLSRWLGPNVRDRVLADLQRFEYPTMTNTLAYQRTLPVSKTLQMDG